MRHEDAPLEITLDDGRLSISIGIATLAFAVTHGAGVEGVYRIADPWKAAESIRHYLLEEDEEGTTPVHTLLDKAAWEAWEQGEEGFAEPPPSEVV